MRSALLAGSVALAAAVLALGVPFVTRERDVLETVPQPLPLANVAVVPLGPGATACTDRVTVTTDSAEARLRVATYGRAAQPLAFELRLPDGIRTAPVAATYRDGVPVRVPFAAPGRDVLGRVCVRNRGRARIGLYASEDTKTRSVTTVGGRRAPANPQLSFHPRATEDLVSRLPEALRRMALLDPGGAAWPAVLTVLVLLAVPLAVLWALGRAISREPR
jgi:hypothetical protein